MSWSVQCVNVAEVKVNVAGVIVDVAEVMVNAAGVMHRERAALNILVA